MYSLKNAHIIVLLCMHALQQAESNCYAEFDVRNMRKATYRQATYRQAHADTTRCSNNRKVFVYGASETNGTQKNGKPSYYNFLPRRPDVHNPLYTHDPAGACLFAVYMGYDYSYATLSELPYWNGGDNHLLIDFTDFNCNGAPAHIIGKAMLANSFMTTKYFRPNFDLPLPIMMQGVSANVERLLESGVDKLEQRKYFITFKGTVYRPGSPGSYRWDLLNMAPNNSRIVMHLKCFKLHGCRDTDAFKPICDRLDKTYAESNYIDLFNTTFALIPGGRQPATYRLMEAMAAAAVPVFVYPEVDWVKPYAQFIEWDALSLTFTPDQIPQIMPRLRALSDPQIAAMRKQVRAAFRAHFGRSDEAAEHLFAHARQQVMRNLSMSSPPVVEVGALGRGLHLMEQMAHYGVPSLVLLAAARYLYVVYHEH